MLALGSLMYIS